VKGDLIGYTVGMFAVLLFICGVLIVANFAWWLFMSKPK
jgi:hypothetical protein